MRIAVLADTHAPRFWKICPPAVAARLDGADAILHAGDVCTSAVLDELSGWAPVYAVRGNNDGPDVAAWGAPETVTLELGGLPITRNSPSRLSWLEFGVRINQLRREAALTYR